MKYLCSYREERYGYFEVESNHRPTDSEVAALAKDGREIDYRESEYKDIVVEQQGNIPQKKNRDHAR